VMLPYMNTGLKVAQDVGGLILPMWGMQAPWQKWKV
jgi:hypothetical protein